MTAYIANHQKKKRLLQKREAKLLHAIRNGFPTEKIAAAAEKVKEAKLGVFKAMFAKDSVLPASKFEPTNEALRWQNMTAKEILVLYT